MARVEKAAWPGGAKIWRSEVWAECRDAPKARAQAHQGEELGFGERTGLTPNSVCSHLMESGSARRPSWPVSDAEHPRRAAQRKNRLAAPFDSLEFGALNRLNIDLDRRTFSLGDIKAKNGTAAARPTPPMTEVAITNRRRPELEEECAITVGSCGEAASSMWPGHFCGAAGKRFRVIWVRFSMAWHQSLMSGQWWPR